MTCLVTCGVLVLCRTTLLEAQSSQRLGSIYTAVAYHTLTRG
jgi:hypothetical protein